MRRLLTVGRESVSLIRMRREQAIAARQKLLGRLPVTGEILRGSLLTRTIRNHAGGCAKCASGEGHRLSVLTVSYPGGRTRQFSLRRQRVAEVRRWLRNYQKLKGALEAICEINHELLRPVEASSKRRNKRHD
jgi:hypothetical protein